MNRKCVGMLHGQYLVGEEFIKTFSTAQSLSVFISSQTESLILKDFFNENKCFKTSNQKFLNIMDKLRLLGLKVSINNDVINTTWQNYILNENLAENFEIYEKISFKGVIYTTYLSSNKKCDYCIRNKENKFGLIRCFITNNQNVYVIVKKLTFFYSPFNYNYKNTIFPSKISLTHETDEFFVDKIDNIEKIVFIKLNETACYISLFRSSHLFS